jgi:hypothetical protein
MAAKYYSTDGLPGTGSGEQSDVRAKGPMEGWDSYRRWLANVTSRHSKRSELDSTLYTWAGYRDWVKKVQSEWDEDA